jgi:hypothetical protein
LQLLAARSSLAILRNGVSGPGNAAPDEAVRAVDDVRRDPPVFAARSGLGGLATCFGASTVTEGSVAEEPVGICDAAGPHSRTVDKAATVEGTTRLDDNLMTMSFLIPHGDAVRVKSTLTHSPG